MANQIAAVALQYSKWLSRFICWIWAIYRFSTLIGSIIRPEAAEALASTLYNLDWIMLVNEGTYLVNSLGEKYLYSDRFILRWLDRGGLKNMVGRVISLRQESKEEEQAYEEEEEGEGNG